MGKRANREYQRCRRCTVTPVRRAGQQQSGGKAPTARARHYGQAYSPLGSVERAVQPELAAGDAQRGDGEKLRNEQVMLTNSLWACLG